MSRFKDLLSDVVIRRSPAARASDPDTSHLAAEQNPRIRDNDRARVLAVHAQHPMGLTDHELAEFVGRQQTSCGKRRGELMRAGLIEATGQRRAAPSGALCLVWRITPRGIAEANKRAA